MECGMRTWETVETSRDCWDSGAKSDAASTNFCKNDPPVPCLNFGEFRRFQNYTADCSLYSAPSWISEKVCTVVTHFFKVNCSRLSVALTVLKATMFAVASSRGRSRSLSLQRGEVLCFVSLSDFPFTCIILFKPSVQASEQMVVKYCSISLYLYINNCTCIYTYP